MPVSVLFEKTVNETTPFFRLIEQLTRDLDASPEEEAAELVA